ncbi:hypothetical protein BsWGS_07048 [Bradybaena similaris]
MLAYVVFVLLQPFIMADRADDFASALLHELDLDNDTNISFYEFKVFAEHFQQKPALTLECKTVRDKIQQTAPTLYEFRFQVCTLFNARFAPVTDDGVNSIFLFYLDTNRDQTVSKQEMERFVRSLWGTP